MRKAHYSGPWRTIRKQILERDGYICQIQAAGCTIAANQVDHIIPVSKGGPWWDTANLRAALAFWKLYGWRPWSGTFHA